MAMRLSVDGLCCGYGGREVLRDVSFDVARGQIACLLGPNGAGKTTLFKAILGFLKPRSGTVSVDGRDTRDWGRREFARTVGYVPQSHVPPFPFTVEDVVAMGRTAHLGAFGVPGKADGRIAEEAMAALGILGLRDRAYTEISGGERQMALIARAIAQRPDFLVLDEPTSNLDFGNQMRVLGEIRALAAEGLGVVMTSHAPNHAFLCADTVLLMGRGGIRSGAPAEVITEESMREVYGVEVRLAESPGRGGARVRSCVPVL